MATPVKTKAMSSTTPIWERLSDFSQCKGRLKLMNGILSYSEPHTCTDVGNCEISKSLNDLNHTIKTNRKVSILTCYTEARKSFKELGLHLTFPKYTEISPLLQKWRSDALAPVSFPIASSPMVSTAYAYVGIDKDTYVGIPTAATASPAKPLPTTVVPAHTAKPPPSSAPLLVKPSPQPATIVMNPPQPTALVVNNPPPTLVVNSLPPIVASIPCPPLALSSLPPTVPTASPILNAIPSVAPAPMNTLPSAAPAPPAEENMLITVKWNTYANNMSSVMPALLQDGKFVDVTLACDGKFIKCHKVILGACSTYFEALLSANPCKHPIILMKDFEFWEIQAIVDFMYKGMVHIPQSWLPSLLRVANILKIKGLRAKTDGAAKVRDNDSAGNNVTNTPDRQASQPMQVNLPGVLGKRKPQVNPGIAATPAMQNPLPSHSVASSSLSNKEPPVKISKPTSLADEVSHTDLPCQQCALCQLEFSDASAWAAHMQSHRQSQVSEGLPAAFTPCHQGSDQPMTQTLSSPTCLTFPPMDTGQTISMPPCDGSDQPMTQTLSSPTCLTFPPMDTGQTMTMPSCEVIIKVETDSRYPDNRSDESGTTDETLVLNPGTDNQTHFDDLPLQTRIKLESSSRECDNRAGEAAADGTDADCPGHFESLTLPVSIKQEMQDEYEEDEDLSSRQHVAEDEFSEDPLGIDTDSPYEDQDD